MNQNQGMQEDLLPAGNSLDKMHTTEYKKKIISHTETGYFIATKGKKKAINRNPSMQKTLAEEVGKGPFSCLFS